MNNVDSTKEDFEDLQIAIERDLDPDSKFYTHDEILRKLKIKKLISKQGKELWI